MWVPHSWRKMTSSPYPFMRGRCGEAIALLLYMRVHNMENLTWGHNTVELEKNAQQRVDFLRVLSKNDMPQKQLVSCSCSLRAHWLSVCVHLVLQLQGWAEETTPGGQKRPGCFHPTRWGAGAFNTNTGWKEFQPYSHQYIQIRGLWCVFLA